MWITIFRESSWSPFFWQNEGVSGLFARSYPQLFELELSVPTFHMRIPAPAVYIDYSLRIWILPIRLWPREKSAHLQNPGQGGSLPFYRYHFIQDIMERVYGIWMD